MRIVSLHVRLQVVAALEKLSALLAMACRVGVGCVAALLATIEQFCFLGDCPASAWSLWALKAKEWFEVLGFNFLWKGKGVHTVLF